jgi:hypothetical protein
MELREANGKANQILDEERANPTVRYNKTAIIPGSLGQLAAALSTPQELQQIRSERPRSVQENPLRWVFESTNYTLLCALLSQVPEKDRHSFLTSALLRIVSAPGCARARGQVYPVWNGLSSELPLVAEFCVRNGAKEDFFRVLGEANPLAGHPLLLTQLEDMIALNFTLFTDAEYQRLELSVSNLAQTVHAHQVKFGLKRILPPQWDQIKDVTLLGAVFREVLEAANGIKEQCRKARYLYLKASLLEGLNLEVNQDKEAVDSYLLRLGFSPTLIECLDQADRLYREGGDAFTLKSSMGHLRSFLENLHAEALPAVYAKGGGVIPEGWGEGLTFLRTQGIISQAEEKFAGGLYTLISDEAVHPLIAEREYARLARNVVIEYALLFLRKLEKLGFRLTQRET